MVTSIGTHVVRNNRTIIFIETSTFHLHVSLTTFAYGLNKLCGIEFVGWL